jgi:hypothetical protein
MSHLEWFEAEGWITEDAGQFMKTTIRGAFIPTRGALFPVDAVVRDIRYEQRRLGTIGSLIAQR